MKRLRKTFYGAWWSACKGGCCTEESGLKTLSGRGQGSGADGEPFQNLDTVGGNHYSGPHLVQLFEKPHQLHADLVIKVACRLICEKEFGIANYGAGNGNALLLPT